MNPLRRTLELVADVTPPDEIAALSFMVSDHLWGHLCYSRPRQLP